MPKSVRYKASSVVYFHGDTDERIYILKSGRVVLRSQDIETGQEIHDLVTMGEFFGVRSALGRYPREEDALVSTDAELIQFSVTEFEQVVSANTRIIVKMLKVFSSQLRRIHTKVSSMLKQQDTMDPEEGLHNSALFYYRTRQFDHATYIWNRYQELYPHGRHLEEARKNLERIGHGAAATADEGGRGGGSAAVSQAPSRREAPQSPSRLFFEGERAFAQDDFEGAIGYYQKVLSDYPDDEEYALKAKVELGRSYFEKGDYATTLRHFSQLIQAVPRLPQMAEVLYYVGASYARNGNSEKAKMILGKARASGGDDSALLRRIDRALKDMEG
ncbi:Outer membrane lipoprotein [Alkalispirochaeta americana]|uniref:Outer membrane lipoprotein n=1 Tax=Alkalispirochaeta americana TaxID=159291 RepID=A0A1N6QT92_9SPIO|nr:cyclic nucleotide-binding domain-containing protein [Alkalispirochaeta americana]SIQ19811.1 Outer membrane lipoprotein [Alkalispirochaeta americana]